MGSSSTTFSNSSFALCSISLNWSSYNFMISLTSSLPMSYRPCLLMNSSRAFSSSPMKKLVATAAQTASLSSWKRMNSAKFINSVASSEFRSSQNSM